MTIQAIKGFCFLIFFSISVFGAQAQKKNRPKIGVVLSGGGAKGLSHVGFLKALEEAGIVPDYITGTSMGAIVGALYSIGYTVEQIEEIARQINWKTTLSNDIRLDRVAYEEKEYFGRYLTELTFKKGKLYLPSAIIEGQNLQLLLSRLTLPAHNISSFDSLPIPFACVGADIENGEPVTLNKGNLANALRATMAIPTIFTPVERDGRILVDGGLIRNFPAEEVKNLGADIILGSYVGGKFKSRDNLNTFADILKQSAFVTSIFDYRNQSKLCDFLVEPDLTGYGPSDFESFDSISSRGYIATLPYLHELKALADTVYRNAPPKERTPLKIQKEFRLNRIEVYNNKQVSKKFILGKLRLKESRIYSIEQIEKQIDKAYGSQLFKSVTYSITGDSISGHTLNIKVKEKPSTRLKFAVHYDTETNAGITLNLTSRNKIFSESRLVFELDVATQPRANLQYLKYIGKRHLWAFMGGAKWIRQTKFPLFNLADQEALFNAHYLDFYAGGQTTFSSSFTLGAQLERSIQTYTPVVNADSILKGVSVFNLSMNYFWKIDSRNHPFFPTKGILLDAHFIQRFGAKQKIDLLSRIENTGDDFEERAPSYNSIQARINQFFPLTKWLTISYNGFLGENFTTDPAISDFYFFGGHHPISPNSIPFHGGDPYRFIAEDLLLVGGAARIEFMKNLYFTSTLNIGDAEIPARIKNKEIEKIIYRGKQFNQVIGGSLEIAYMTPFGPIRLAASRHSQSAKTNLYFGVGFNF